LFPDTDDKILKYLDDDGLLVEPLFYAPIIPMVLVNGSKGIGTGFSTDIMCYNPLEIIGYLKNKLTESSNAHFDFVPYYEVFNGTISKILPGKFLIKGKYEKVGPDKIRVTELPVGRWTEDFKEYLESLTESTDKAGKKVTPVVKDYDDMSKDTTVDFIITLQKGKLDELEAISLDNGCNGLEKQFKLFTTGSTTNMHLFDSEDKLKKYATVSEIIDDYFDTRLKMYQTRKDYMIDALTRELVLLSNKSRYIKENLDGTVDLRRKKRDDVNLLLKQKGYDIIDNDEDFKYLVKLPMDSVTDENVAKILKEHGDKAAELDAIKAKTIQQMWTEELDALVVEYAKYRDERERTMMGTTKKAAAKVVKKQKLVITN
jgi:DNA topoisomerase-2